MKYVVVSIYYFRSEMTYYFMVPEDEVEEFLQSIDHNIGVKHDEPGVYLLNSIDEYDNPFGYC